MKTKIATRIVSNTEISKGIYRLALAGAPGSGGLSDIADTAAPGQFVNVYLNNKTMLLPRPFGISNIEINADGEAGADGKTCEGGGTGVDGETREGDGTGVDGETREGDGTGVDGGTNRSNDESHIVLVYAVVGAGTAELASCVPGAAIQILGPQGNGYDLDALGRHVLLIGGGLGIPPLLFAARRIRESALPQGSMKITALLGYRDVPYYADDFGRYCDEVFCISENAARRGEQNNESSHNDVQGTASCSTPQPAASHRHRHYKADVQETVSCFTPQPAANHRHCHYKTDVQETASCFTPQPRVEVAAGINGTVMDLIAALVAEDRLDLSDVSILSCGPTPMLKAVAGWAAKRGIPAQVSLEERMGCGYGACVGCTVEIKSEGTAFVRPAPTGPVFGKAEPTQSDAAFLRPAPTGPVPGKAEPTQSDTAFLRPAPTGPVPDKAEPTQSDAAFVRPAPTGTVRKKICKDGPVFPADTVIWR